MPTLDSLIHVLAEYACVPEESIGYSEPLAAIGIDSLDHAQLILALEDEFQIELPESAELTTVAALHDAIKQAQAA